MIKKNNRLLFCRISVLALTGGMIDRAAAGDFGNYAEPHTYGRTIGPKFNS